MLNHRGKSLLIGNLYTSTSRSWYTRNFRFPFFPHVTEYISVIFFPSIDALKDLIEIWTWFALAPEYFQTQSTLLHLSLPHAGYEVDGKTSMVSRFHHHTP